MWTGNQGNQNDWPKETQKTCPIKVIQTATRAQRETLSEPAPASVHVHRALHLLHCLPSSWGPFSAKLRARGPVTDHWSDATRPLSGWGPKPHHKPSQARANRHHERALPTVKEPAGRKAGATAAAHRQTERTGPFPCGLEAGAGSTSSCRPRPTLPAAAPPAPAHLP